jgi:hypothetical protein
MPYAVKLLHPGGERDVAVGNTKTEGEMDWAIDYRALNMCCGGHRRKFISCDGQYLTSLDNTPVKDKIMFWGEWEPPSRYKKLSHSSRGSDGLPSYIHTPSIRCVRANERVLNTDPYVLGTTFYWQNMTFLKTL